MTAERHRKRRSPGEGGAWPYTTARGSGSGSPAWSPCPMAPASGSPAAATSPRRPRWTPCGTCLALAIDGSFDHRRACGRGRGDVGRVVGHESFTTAQVATVVGFMLLIGFAFLAFHVRSATAAITTGALGAVSAALTGYIGRTFIRSQEMSAKHLRAYFDQPLEFSRYLAAERLVSGQGDQTPEERAILLKIIVEGMINNHPG